MVFGEAGALMLIETEEHAKARGAPILGRLMGAAITSDGYDVVEPDPSGERAGDAISPRDRAGRSGADGHRPRQRPRHRHHRSATWPRPSRSGNALGDHTPAVYAPKAALGHSLGAAGAVEAVLTVQALRDGVVPATRNLKTSIPRSTWTWSPSRPRTATTGTRSPIRSASAATTWRWCSARA